MDLTLTQAQREIQARTRTFVREVLQPLEGEFERAAGRLRLEARDLIRRESVKAGLVGGPLRAEVGGQGWSMLEQVLVHEQLGQSTGGLWSFIPGAYNALAACDLEQRRRYLDPSLRGERFGSYASRNRVPGRMRGPLLRPRSVTPPPGSTSSTGRSGSSPARPTRPTS